MPSSAQVGSAKRKPKLLREAEQWVRRLGECAAEVRMQILAILQGSVDEEFAGKVRLALDDEDPNSLEQIANDIELTPELADMTSLGLR